MLNNKTIDELINIGIFDSKAIPKTNKKEVAKIYRDFELSDENIYEEVDTHGLTEQDISIQIAAKQTHILNSINKKLEIQGNIIKNQSKDIHFIKQIVLINIILSIIGGTMLIFPLMFSK